MDSVEFGLITRNERVPAMALSWDGNGENCGVATAIRYRDPAVIAHVTASPPRQAKSRWHIFYFRFRFALNDS
jgi:hypothetical protein